MNLWGVPCNAPSSQKDFAFANIMWWHMCVRFDTLEDYHSIYPKTNKFVCYFYFTHPTNVNLWLYTMKHVILFKVAPSLNYCRFNKIGTLLHYWTTYTWTNNQDWLLKVITSSQPAKINWSFGTTFITCKMMLCIALAMD